MTLNGAVTPIPIASYVMSDTASPDAIIKHIKTTIQSIARSKRFIERRESSAFTATLEKILYEIESQLLPNHPKQAIKILDSFLALGECVMNRCDDSNGDIGDAFRYAVVMWGKAWSLLPDFTGHILAESLWKHFENNDYGLLDKMISSAADALKRTGLDELESLVKSQSGAQVHFRIFHALQDIAVIRQSPEAFLEVFKFTGRQETMSDQLKRARLLIQSSRKQEAISLLESIDDTAHYGRDSLDLLIELYNGEGNVEKAQALRWRGFITRSDLNYYHVYTENLDSASDQKQALNSALEFARNNPQLLTAIQLLNDLGYPDQAACVLREKYEQLNGHFYSTLLQTAENFLITGHLLEVVLIYRRLSESLLERALSKYYHHAIGYLKKEKKLGANVKDWMTYPPTREYFNELAKQHSKKSAFMKEFTPLMAQV